LWNSLKQSEEKLKPTPRTVKEARRNRKLVRPTYNCLISTKRDKSHVEACFYHDGGRLCKSYDVNCPLNFKWAKMRSARH
jgi:hypothetical protein